MCYLSECTHLWTFFKLLMTLLNFQNSSQSYWTLPHWPDRSTGVETKTEVNKKKCIFLIIELSSYKYQNRLILSVLFSSWLEREPRDFNFLVNLDDSTLYMYVYVLYMHVHTPTHLYMCVYIYFFLSPYFICSLIIWLLFATQWCLSCSYSGYPLTIYLTLWGFGWWAKSLILKCRSWLCF